MASSRACWLISVPNERNQVSPETIQSIKHQIASSKNDYSECHEYELPPDLLVGTLDSLMTLSDELQRVDLTIENVVRKIERQFNDLNQGDEYLTVDGVPVERYLNHFSWDEAKHPHRRPLKEIMGHIQSTMGKVEDELKQLGSMYTEKKQHLLQIHRKKGGNLMVANLDELLTPSIVSADDFVNTEYLQTLVAIIPKNLEKQFLEEYATIGNDIAQYGPKTGPGKMKGSPVVPNSARKLLEDGNSCVYTITLLKGQYQPGYVDEEGHFEQGSFLNYIEDFKTLAREKKYIAREFTFNPSAHRENQQEKAGLEVEVDRLWSGLLRWCKAHFGEAFIAWMHIKAIRIFVESVLRYGLPVNFAALLVRPHKGKDNKARAALDKMYSHLQPKEFTISEDNSSSSQGPEFFSYVSNAFVSLTQ